MEQFPHRYKVSTSADTAGSVTITSDQLPSLVTAPPRQFGGPGDQWSPETLLVAAVADCFILTFRAIARASKLKWSRLSCTTEGVLDRVEGVTRFTEILIQASLQLPESQDKERGYRLLEKAENSCLITKSLSAATKLESHIDFPES